MSKKKQEEIVETPANTLHVGAVIQVRGIDCAYLGNGIVEALNGHDQPLVIGELERQRS